MGLPSVQGQGSGNQVNYYEHHLGDYLRDTAHLSMIEDGAYRRLMDAYYISEAPFPDDKRELMKVCRAVTKPERDAVEYVLKKFFAYDPGSGWSHSRCEREIARYRARQEKAKASADARWSAQRAQSERNANASPEHDAGHMRSHDPSNANGMHRAPVPSNQTPVTTLVPKVQRESARGSRLPPGWTPEPVHMAFADGLGLSNGKAAAELEKFRDYWAAQPGQKGVKTDWPATWRNWVRRVVDDQGGKAPATTAGAFAGVL